MVKNIIENEIYRDLIVSQINEIINYLLKNNEKFAITVNIKACSFKPPLPNPIASKMQEYSLFVLDNYTYTTIKINNKIMSFETGFGNENFGSVVSVPLEAIFQIIIDDSILYLNPVATVEKFYTNQKEKSLNIFKNNPKNRRFSDD